MFNAIRWKFVAAAAIVAMMVSVLSGGLNGIVLGAILFRALLGGVVFAVLAVGLNLLAAREFPELLSDGDSDQADGVSGEQGSRVNILEGEAENDLPSDAGEATSATEGVLPEPRFAAEGGPPEDSSDGVNLGRFEDSERVSGNLVDEGAPVDGEGQDPMEIAQAIRTVIKRDEKG